MKKFFNVLMCAVCAAALFSCAKEKDSVDSVVESIVVPDGYSLVTYTARQATKTDINAAGQTVWVSGDKIKIVLNDGSAIDAELTDGENSTVGSFTGMVPEGKSGLYAVYPAGAYASVSGETVNVAVPADQEGTFSAGNIAFAKIGENKDMSFQNLNSFFIFQLKTGSEVTKVEVESVDGSVLAGTIPVDLSGASPAVGTAESPASKVTMTTSGAGTYYLSVISGVTHAKGLKMSYFKGATETGVYYLNKSITVAASTRYPLGEVETDRNYYVTVSGAGNKNGMDWANAFSAGQMWKKLQLSGTDAESDAAKVAAINGATFHLGAGEYIFGDTPLLSFNEANPVVLTFKGDYPAAGGDSQNRDGSQRANFSGDGTHAALILRGNMDVTFDGIGFINGQGTGDEEATDASGLSVAASLDIVGTDLSVTMSHCDVKNNTHADAGKTSGGNWGAGVRLLTVGSFAADSVTFAHNSGYAAAGLSVRDSDVDIQNCLFLRNTTSGEVAAGMYIAGDNTVADIASSTFEANVAENKNGGAVSMTGKATGNFTGCSFIDNSAKYEADSYSRTSGDGYGGAVNLLSNCVANFTNCNFSRNIAWRGGALHCNSGGTVSIVGCTFTANGLPGATRGGGVAYVQKNTTFTDCTFGGPAVADGNLAYYGGALEVVGSTTTVKGGSFLNNSAGDSGGAISQEASLTLTMDDNNNPTCFQDNVAVNTGGAVHIEGSGTTNINDAIFKGNHVTSEDSGNGGALRAHNYNSKAPKVNITDCTFGGTAAGEANYSAMDGGALSLEIGTITITDTDFIGNYALNDDASRTTPDKGYGGAIDCYSNAAMTISGGRFEKNNAWRGGAINSSTSKAVTISADFIQNGNLNTVRDGGAVRIGKGTVTFNNCTMTGNRGAYGGCIHAESSGSIVINNGSFGGNNESDWNRAQLNSGSNGNGGVIALYGSSKLEMTGATLTKNSARQFGGTIYHSSGGTCVVKGCTIDGSHADYGGALCTGTGSLGRVTFGGGTVKNCYAKGGGAFMLRATHAVEADTYGGKGTLFKDNYADDGSWTNFGGYCYGGAIKMESNTTLKLFRSRLVGNHAEDGGAIYADNIQKDSNNKQSKFPILYIDECSFEENYITNSWGPDISLDGFELFCLNNTSFKNSYTTNANMDSKPLRPSWICIDGIKKDGDAGLSGNPAGTVSISNCSIIGNVQYYDGTSFHALTGNTALVAIWGAQTNYLTNNIIVSENAGIASVSGEGSEVLDLYYNHFTSTIASTIAADVQTVTGILRSDLDGLNWVSTQTNGNYTTDGFWSWDNKVGGVTPVMGSQTDISNRISTLCPDFADWLGSDINNDQRRVGRGSGDWWPGAYQVN